MVCWRTRRLDRGRSRPSLAYAAFVHPARQRGRRPWMVCWRTRRLDRGRSRPSLAYAAFVHPARQRGRRPWMVCWRTRRSALAAAGCRQRRLGLRKLGHQLYALRLAAGQGRALLAEREVPEPDVLEQAQGMVDGGVRGEEFARGRHVHVQYLGDGLVLVAHGQRLGVEARPTARLARHGHVREEAHLDGLEALAFAGRATSAGDVEGEARRSVAAQARLRSRGEQLADGVPEPDVGGGTGAWRLADRCLVDFQHARERFDAANRFTASGFRGPVARGEQRAHAVVQHLAHQRALARARYAGDAGQAPERETDVDPFEIV